MQFTTSYNRHQASVGGAGWAGGGPRKAIDSLIIMVEAVVNYEGQKPISR